MAEQQNKKTVPELEKIKLEPNEIMRISVFETEEGFATVCLTDGPQLPIMEAFMEIADKLDLMCVPKFPPILEDVGLPVAVVVCPRRTSQEDSEDGSEKPQED